MKRAGLALLCLGVLAAQGMISAQEPPAVIETESLRWEIAPDGHVIHFVDKQSGQDFLDAAPHPAAARIKKGGQSLDASSARLEGTRLTLSFGDNQAAASLDIRSLSRYVTIEVSDVSGEGIEELAFLDIPLTLKGSLDEPFACCALALNLQTNVPEVPGPHGKLRAMCYPRYGMPGAKVAVIACPQSELRDVMKEAVSAAPDLPHSDIGGPWALDAPCNRGSYLFDFGALTEQTVDAWIACVRSLGLNQIDFHTGTSLRFGDCEPNPKLFPNGRASVKAVLDKLHAAGIAAGLHTYAFFIAKNARYVSPVPDPRLGKDAVFTLAEPLTSEAVTVPVAESTSAMSTITGFFVHNSVTVQIDDELITYGGVAKEAPFAFTSCTRGAHGTHAAAHEAGAKVHHLKECFGLFTPDADSTLLEEVAANTADTFNECGFDMIYLDALDGESILAGADQAWHYGSKFVFEIAKRLKKPALFEMSTFHHHLWYVRARMGAWDHPTRSHKRFIDAHCAANQQGAGMFLPMNLGWWSVLTWDEAHAIQREPTYPDDIEYLMAKSLGNDMGISLMGVNPDTIASVPAYKRLAPLFKQYEDLRHAQYFPESVKAKLRVPGAEFTLEQNAEGAWQFRPLEVLRHKVEGVDERSNRWTVKNAFGPQPVRFRIEALMAAAAYDAPESVVVEDFSKPEAYSAHEAASGVTATLATSTEQVKVGSVSGRLDASSDRPNPDGAWSKTGRVFSPTLNIAKQQGLGVWVYGDGQGELLNLQMRSPEHTANLGYGDHYIPVDFSGWRYFELVEIEGGHIADFAWPYSGNNYAVYREAVDFGQIESFSLWYNLLPQGKPARCYLSPIKALPLVKSKLSQPKLTLGGKTLVLPVDLESGSYLEFHSMTDCKLYGAKGDLLAEVVPQGEAPVLESGENMVEFACDAPAGLNVRARVTFMPQGEPFRE